MVRVVEIKPLLQGCQRSPIHQWLLLTPCQSHCSYPELQLKIHHLKYRLLNQANPAQYLYSLWLLQMMLSL